MGVGATVRAGAAAILESLRSPSTVLKSCPLTTAAAIAVALDLGSN